MLERTCVLVVGRVECKIVVLGVTPELVSLNDEGRKRCAKFKQFLGVFFTSDSDGEVYPLWSMSTMVSLVCRFLPPKLKCTMYYGC
jgi:hypothetical protein